MSKTSWYLEPLQHCTYKVRHTLMTRYWPTKCELLGSGLSIENSTAETILERQQHIKYTL